MATALNHKVALFGYAALARRLWPDRLELTALFDPCAVQEPFKPPCCSSCQKSGIKLSACSKCHAVRYCSTACQTAHWRAHKPACISPKDVTATIIANYNK